MADADIPQLVSSINELLSRICRQHEQHEHQNDCLCRENRFLAAQVKRLSDKKDVEESERQAKPSRSKASQIDTPPSSPKSLRADAFQLPDSYQQPYPSVTSYYKEDDPAPIDARTRMNSEQSSSQQLLAMHMTARKRVISTRQEDTEDQSWTSPMAHVPSDGLCNFTDIDHHHIAQITPDSSQDEQVPLPATLGMELDNPELISRDLVDRVSSLEHMYVIPWSKGDDSAELSPVWKERRKSLGRIAQRALCMKKGASALPVVESTNSQDSSFVAPRKPTRLHTKVARSLLGLWQAKVSRPSSQRRLIWDIFGMALIVYDVIVIPLSAFDLPQNLFVLLMAWVCTVYWTLDIPFSFVVGYHSKGVLEMRPLQIAQHYARTWLAFDVGVVSVDWMVSLAEHLNLEKNERVGYLRFGRFGRFLRMLRLLRLLKLHGMIVDIFERIQSELLRIVLGIVNILIFIVLINHVMACGWYWVGTNTFNAGYPSWVVESELGGRSIPYNYTTSVHWSLTQFTPASMEVVPQNTFERTYNVCTLLFAMCTFSSFVSSITNAMTRLRNLNSESADKATQLRRYLKENRIPGAMCNRIWAWLQTVENTSRCRIHAAQVAILHTLPIDILNELHRAIYSPFLAKHPWFSNFQGAHPDGMRSLYSCLVEVGIDVGKESFHCGETATRMYFVFSGRLRYLREGEMSEMSWEASQIEEVVRIASLGSMPHDDGDGPIVIGPDQWASEHPLWINWTHVGTLTALSHCELFTINAQRFQEVMQYELLSVWQAAKYARAFLSHLHSSISALSDVWADPKALLDLATHAFTLSEDDIPSSISSGDSSTRPGSVRSPQNRPSPTPSRSHRRSSSSSVGTRPSMQSASSRASRESGVSKRLGTPAQQIAHAVSGNPLSKPEASDGSLADAETACRLSGRSEQGLPFPRTSRGLKLTTI